MQFLKLFSIEETKNLASLLLKIVVLDVVYYLTARLENGLRSDHCISV